MNTFLFNTIIFLLFSSVSIALAQDATASKSMSAAEIEEITQEISETTMSPFCPGRTISSCPSGQARELRQRIASWLAEGYSRKAVMNQLLNIYGEEVRGMPRKEGFGIMAWIVPGLFVLLSLLFVVLLLKSLNSRDDFLLTSDGAVKDGPVNDGPVKDGAGQEGPGQVDEESLRLIEEELNKRRG